MGKTFYITLWLSVGAHLFIFQKFPNLISRAKNHQSVEEIQIVPIENGSLEKTPPMFSGKILHVDPPSIKEVRNFSSPRSLGRIEKGTMAFSKQDIVGAKDSLEPEFFKERDSLSSKRKPAEDDLSKESFKEMMEAVKKTPAYMEYYRLIRAKIRDAAMDVYTDNEEGNVSIVFVLKRQGEVVAAEVEHEKSNASAFLKTLALQSIKRPSPFPEFPKELDFSRLEFSISIHFKRRSI